MARFLRFIFAVAALPFCAALAMALWCAVMESAVRGMADGIPAGGIAFCAGFLVFFALSLALPAPARAYVLGHEITHALWGLAFGAKVSNIKVGASGGYVTLSKSNVWITLAPYFFPFYTAVVAVVALVWSLFKRPLPCLPAWLFAVGFTWSFHVCLTLRALSQKQPDVLEYGRLFSWSFIWIANALGVMAVLCIATDMTFAQAAALLCDRAAFTYTAVWKAVSGIIHAASTALGIGT